MSNGKIKVRKSKYGASIFPVSKEDLTQPKVQKEQPSEKEIYFGKIKKISRDDDISYLARGNVFFLKDHPNDPNCNTFHPYLVIQAYYLDKIGKISVLGITSTPSSINLIPIVMKNSIGYIDPHQPYTYKIDEFYSDDTRFVGSIVNSRALDIATNMYGLYLGMNLNKTRDEIIEEYMSYVTEFKERTKDNDIKPYKHKVLQEFSLDDIELKISFSTDSSDISEDICNSSACDDNENSIDHIDDDVYDNIINKKPVMEIDLKSQAILSALSMLENMPSDKVKLPANASKISYDEKRIFLACDKINGNRLTALIYNCSHGTVSNRKHQILEEYEVIYKNSSIK